MLPTTARIALVFIAEGPVGIFYNVPTATSFHVNNAFADSALTVLQDSVVLNVGLEAAMVHLAATGLPEGGRAGLRTGWLLPLVKLLAPPIHRHAGTHGLAMKQS